MTRTLPAAVRAAPARRLAVGLLLVGLVAAPARAQRAPGTWLSRLRLTPTVPTDRGSVRSTGGFGLQLGAEWSRGEGRLALPLTFELAGDDRRQIGCVLDCAQGRMSAWLLTGGVVLRPLPSWRLRPWVEGTVSGGLVQWSNAVVPSGLGIGLGGAAIGRTGGGVTGRASAGAGLELRWDDRWITLGVQRGLVHEARWTSSRAVTTLVLGLRARY